MVDDSYFVGILRPWIEEQTVSEQLESKILTSAVVLKIDTAEGAFEILDLYNEQAFNDSLVSNLINAQIFPNF